MLVRQQAETARAYSSRSARSAVLFLTPACLEEAAREGHDGVLHGGLAATEIRKAPYSSVFFGRRHYNISRHAKSFFKLNSVLNMVSGSKGVCWSVKPPVGFLLVLTVSTEPVACKNSASAERSIAQAVG